MDDSPDFAGRPGTCETVWPITILRWPWSNSPMSDARPLVGVVMGSQSDWETMRAAHEMLTTFEVPHEYQIVSAHRTPAWMAEYASSAAGRGLEVIIAGAGGAAHLPGMVAAHTVLPVIGVPIESAALRGLDSLLSIVQMPRGVPVATVAIGAAGAANAGLLAVAILATSRPDLRAKLQAYRDETAASVRRTQLP
jgi:5-(carboxyamino)imidazole ribonucleotide mutase